MQDAGIIHENMLLSINKIQTRHTTYHIYLSIYIRTDIHRRIHYKKFRLLGTTFTQNLRDLLSSSVVPSAGGEAGPAPRELKAWSTTE